MKKMIIFALIMAISVATPIQAMAESVTQSDVEMQPSEQNIEQIIDEITSEPHPINSDTIQNVKEYIIQYWGDLGYDENVRSLNIMMKIMRMQYGVPHR